MSDYFDSGSSSTFQNSKPSGKQNKKAEAKVQNVRVDEFQELGDGECSQRAGKQRRDEMGLDCSLGPEAWFRMNHQQKNILPGR